MNGYISRRKVERDQMIFLAWHVEVMARQDHKRSLPPLERFLGREEKSAVPEEQSDDEILGAMRAWAAMTREGQA